MTGLPSLFMAESFFLIFLFFFLVLKEDLFIFGCARPSLIVESRGGVHSSMVRVPLIVVASLVAERKLEGMGASVGAVRGLSSCGTKT